VALADQAVNSAIALVKEGNKLADLLNSVMKGNDFISEHSMMITYVCSQLGMHLGWDIKSTLEKISMAALLHDSVLPEELSHVRTLKSKEALEFSEEQRKLILEHPEIVASEVSKVTTMYPDVDSILIQHHERPDGSGFPRGLKALSISPLSALFIIAEEFAHAIYGKEVNADLLNDIADDFKAKFDKGNFRKPYQAFEKFLTGF
jgi:HD-GYP domain-containing protein (c-di-GMP phosphodiesterase class II)